MVRAALIACVLAACGDNTGEPADTSRDPAVENGSRLVAERWVSADGTASFARWYDRELDIYCTFQPVGGGDVRCLPTDARVLGFSDAQCTQPAAVASTDCTDVRFARRGDEVVSVEEPLAAGFVRGGDLPCTRDPDTDRRYFAIGGTVPIDSFARADSLAIGTSLSTIEYRGDDGSRQRVALTGRGQATSTAVDLSCVLRLTGSRTAECTFSSSAGNAHTHYSDAACTQPVIEPQGFPDRLTIAYSSRPCAATPLYQLGEFRSVPNVFYRDTSGACASLAIIGTMVFDIAPITGANVPLTLEIDETSTTRLRHTQWVTAAGERWPGPLFDTLLDVPCVPVADRAGHARCVPALNEEFVEQVGVSDAATCDGAALVSTSCWGQTIRPRTAERTACGYTLHDFEQASGDERSGPLHTGVSVGECGPLDLEGAELRDGEYAVTDGAAFVEMRLER